MTVGSNDLFTKDKEKMSDYDTKGLIKKNRNLVKVLLTKNLSTGYISCSKVSIRLPYTHSPDLKVTRRARGLRVEVGDTTGTPGRSLRDPKVSLVRIMVTLLCWKTVYNSSKTSCLWNKKSL